MEKAIKTFNNHPSILRIFQEGYPENSFSVDIIFESSIHNIISNIDSSKVYQRDNIPPQLFKNNVGMYTF